jgi:hypothetical protein
MINAVVVALHVAVAAAGDDVRLSIVAPRPSSCIAGDAVHVKAHLLVDGDTAAFLDAHGHDTVCFALSPSSGAQRVCHSLLSNVPVVFNGLNQQGCYTLSVTLLPSGDAGAGSERVLERVRFAVSGADVEKRCTLACGWINDGVARTEGAAGAGAGSHRRAAAEDAVVRFLAPRNGSVVVHDTPMLVALSAHGFEVPAHGAVALEMLLAGESVPFFEHTVSSLSPFDVSGAPLGDLLLRATLLPASGGRAATTMVRITVAEQGAHAGQSYRRQEGFRLIYAGQHWSSAGGGSGQGSTLPNTAALRELLVSAVPALGVRSILDAGCGAMHWQPLVLARLQREANHAVAYHGVDIVPELIEKHRATFADQPEWTFASTDLARDAAVLPAYDLVVCKDVLFHNTNAAVAKILRLVSASRSRYMLATSHVDASSTGTLNANRTEVGTDGRAMELGGFRPLDLEQPPFGLPRPELMLLVAEPDRTSAPDLFIGLWSLPLAVRSSAPRAQVLVRFDVNVGGANARFALRRDDGSQPWSARLAFCTPPTAGAVECVHAARFHVGAGVDVLTLRTAKDSGMHPQPRSLPTRWSGALTTALTSLAAAERHDAYVLDANPAEDDGLFMAFASAAHVRIAVVALLVGSDQGRPLLNTRNMVDAGLRLSGASLFPGALTAWRSVPDALAHSEVPPLALRARVKINAQGSAVLVGRVGQHGKTLESLLDTFGGLRPRCIILKLVGTFGSQTLSVAALLGKHASHYSFTAESDASVGTVHEPALEVVITERVASVATTGSGRVAASDMPFVLCSGESSEMPLRVGITSAGGHLNTLLYSTFRQVCPTRAVVVGPVGSLSAEGPLHIVVTQAIDGGCSDSWDWYCQTEAHKIVQAHAKALHIIWVGEPWDMSSVRSAASGDLKDVTLVHTQRDCGTECVYIPVVSVSFSHRLRDAMHDLVRPRRVVADKPTHKFAAYMYARCDGLERHRRESFFDLLSKYKPVDALGACKSTPRERFARSKRRHRDDYLDAAVEAFRGYRFVVAFENQAVKGYVSEKLANAMLANAIAIYSGAPDVSSLFNPRSFIDCSALDLATCVELVRRVDQNETLYLEMLAEPRLAKGKLANPFSWEANHAEYATGQGFPAQLGHALDKQLRAREELSSQQTHVVVVGIDRPTRGARLPTSMVVIRATLDLLAAAETDFLGTHGDTAQLCFALHDATVAGRHLQKLCVELWVATITMRDVQVGSYDLHAWMRSASGEVLSPISSTQFEVVPPSGSSEKVSPPSRRPSAPKREVTAAVPFLDSYTPSPDSSAVFGRRHSCAPNGRRRSTVVVGVKVAAWMFSTRAAIRETWMRRGREQGVNAVVWFIVGRATPSARLDVERLVLEAKTHGDMLLEADINVTDSYTTLVQKTVTFMVWASRRYEFGHMMIVDADVFIRLDTVVSALALLPRERFLAGQVWKEQFRRRIRPVREADMRNYLPKSVYPMDELPPFAYGGHYVISSDCVDFIVSNRHALRGVGDLEDVSVSFWLLAMQVHPEHVTQFGDAHTTACANTLASFAGITDEAMRAMHSNLEKGAPLCVGFDTRTWTRAVRLTIDHDST